MPIHFSKKSIFCLMGPTASGKTSLAIDLVQQFPLEIISVDSAMVYRGMDIGTAKPTAELLRVAPHHLIDICDPIEIYSAGQCCENALTAIKVIFAKGKIPLLVGGTMMYFRALLQGLAQLPQANALIRQKLQSRAANDGWEALHAELLKIDKEAAARIKPQDTQRIQRALEVYYVTGKTISAWQSATTQHLSTYQVHTLGLMPTHRPALHERITTRFDQMLSVGFLDEVQQLYQRGDLTADLPAIRSIGYREAWAYLSGLLTKTEMREKAIIATRQLAKRQITWLKSWPDITLLDADQQNLQQEISSLYQRVDSY